MQKKVQEGKKTETGAWFDDGRVVLDKDVAKFVKKHTKFFDRFSVLKMTMAALSSFAILSDPEASKEELSDGWKFNF